MILSQVLAQTAAQRQNEAAIDFLEKKTTYAQLRVAISKLSYLYMNEIGHEARVGFLTSNAPAVITSFFAFSNIRVPSVPLDPSLTDDELGAWIKFCGVTHLAVTEDLKNRARDLKSSQRLSCPLVEIEKKKGGEYDTSFSPPPEHTPTDKDVVLILRTAGTMGGHSGPKYVALNHQQLHHAAVCLRRPYRLMPTDKFLTTMNWSHPFAFVHGMLLPILTGATCVIDSGVRNKEFLELMLKARVTRLVDVPRFFYQLLVFLKNEKQASLPGLKSITVGLGSLSPQLRKTYNLLKVKVGHVYGQTENVWSIAMEDVDAEFEETDRPIYIPLAGLQYKVLDDNGDAYEGSGPFEGPLAVSGPTVMARYTGPEEKKKELEKETRDVLRGTWLYTGDLARVQGEGDEMKLTFLGRKDQCVARGGGQYTVPDVLDRKVKEIQGVEDAAGFVMQNTMGKMMIAVAVVRRKGTKISDKAVADYCAANLGADYSPLAVFFTDEIPRSAYGEVNRNSLRWKFTGGAG